MEFLQHSISGLAAGCLYALAAVGLIMIYKLSHVVNFAQGAIAMFCTFFAFSLIVSAGLPFWGALVGALAAAAVLGMLIEKSLLRPLEKATPLQVVIMTIGVLMVIHGLSGWIWGLEFRSFAAELTGEPVQLGMLSMPVPELASVAFTCIILAILYGVFQSSFTGIVMRAMEENRLAARLLGVKVNRILSFIWAAGSVLGVIMGIFLTCITHLDISIIPDMMVKALAAAVLGGFHSLTKAVAGGLLIGVVETLFANYISSGLDGAFAFVLIFAVLCFRPTGFLGTEEREKV